jgi:hypothetical protein
MTDKDERMKELIERKKKIKEALSKVEEAILNMVSGGSSEIEIDTNAGSRRVKKISLSELNATKKDLVAELNAINKKIRKLKGDEPDFNQQILVEFDS